MGATGVGVLVGRGVAVGRRCTWWGCGVAVAFGVLVGSSAAVATGVAVGLTVAVGGGVGGVVH